MLYAGMKKDALEIHRKAGGAGIAGGKAFLALAGPIGWGITGASTAASVAFLGHKNNKTSSQAVEEAKEITLAGAQLKETEAEISNLIQETDLLLDRLAKEVMLQELRPVVGVDTVHSLCTFRLPAIASGDSP